MKVLCNLRKAKTKQNQMSITIIFVGYSYIPYLFIYSFIKYHSISQSYPRYIPHTLSILFHPSSFCTVFFYGQFRGGTSPPSASGRLRPPKSSGSYPPPGPSAAPRRAHRSRGPHRFRPAGRPWLRCTQGRR